MKFENFIRKKFFINAFWFVLPWILGSSYLWKWSLAPVSVDSFALPFKALLNHRIVLGSHFLLPSLFVFSFLPLFVLLVLFSCFYFALPRPARMGFSFLLSSFFYL